MKGLYKVELYRYLQSVRMHGKILRLPFKDEHGKITFARYRITGIVEGKLRYLTNYIWKLDGRSIRYMRRVTIIENKKNIQNYPAMKIKSMEAVK